MQDPIDRERHLRKQIAIWCWYQLQKKRIITLTELEDHFKRHCEGIMHEFVTRNIFLSSGEMGEPGWYFSRYTDGDTLTEFHQKLNDVYKG